MTDQRPAPKMPPEIRAQWCAALRSGKYEKAKYGYQVDKNEKPCFCVLGVLMKIAGGYNPENACQSIDALDSLLGGVEQGQLASLNDYGSLVTDAPVPGVEPLTFDQLADYIEDQVVCSCGS